MLQDDIRQLIAKLPHEQDDPTLAGVRATYRVEVEGVGVYRLRIDDGRLDILEGPGDADAILYCTPDSVQDVLLGEKNLITAILQGRIEIDGDVAKIFTFHQFLQIRQKRRAEQKGTSPGGARP